MQKKIYHKSFFFSKTKQYYNTLNNYPSELKLSYNIKLAGDTLNLFTLTLKSQHLWDASRELKTAYFAVLGLHNHTNPYLSNLSTWFRNLKLVIGHLPFWLDFSLKLRSYSLISKWSYISTLNLFCNLIKT